MATSSPGSGYTWCNEVAVVEERLHLVDAASCGVDHSFRRRLVFGLRAGFCECELRCGCVARGHGCVVGGLCLVAFLLAHHAFLEEVVEAAESLLGDCDGGLGLSE